MIKRTIIYKTLLLGGFHAFVLTLGVNPLTVLTCIFMTTALLTLLGSGQL